MAIKSTDRKLKIASFNAQGLRNAKRRNAIFRHFKKNNFDVIAIQESYLLLEDKELIAREWGGPFHITEGTKHSKGLLTLFGVDFDESEINNIYFNDRIIISSLNFDDNHITIINIYGPCGEKEKIIFLKDLSVIIDDNILNEDSLTILLGDTNIVKSNNLDLISGLKHSTKSVSEFNNLVNNLKLVDVWRSQNINKKEYTWSKTNSIKSTFIARRLDYIFVNNNLLPFCHNANIKSIGFSDHRAVTLTFNFSAFQRGPSSFKMNVNLLKDMDFINIVKRDIAEVKNLEMDLDPHIRWELIKIKIKSAAIGYGKKKAREKLQDKNILLSKLAEYESQLAKKPTDTELQSKTINVKSQLEIHLMKETEGARIRAGIKWIEKGEMSNSFFLSLEKQKSRNDTIYRMSNHDNIVIKDNDGILNLLSAHYECIYKNPNIHHQNSTEDTFCIPDNDHSLSSEEADLLEGAITEAELHSALASMKNGSSPGIDGIPAEVYKVFWNDLKQLILELFKYTFEQKALPVSQTHGIIKLLYKGNESDREKISSWRPITLLNSDYKIIAKLIAKRLNTVLWKLIDQNQCAFIKGRNAADMIRELEDIIELEKLKGRSSILLSIDYAKAFDTLSTKAINKAMKIYGFKEHFLEWIKILLTERKSCIKNNNYISRFFNMERGVRQGCPLSPLLFICTVELLARSIRNDKNIKGLTINGYGRPIKIRMFADDTTLLLKDQMDFREVLSKIKQFAIFSGLELNKNKSMAMILNNIKVYNRTIYDIKVVNKVKILGIYFSSTEQPCQLEENYQSKIKKLEQICKNWSKRNLSIIGKIIILKTFGISIFTHVMNSIGIDAIRMTQIDKIMFSFIWKKSMSNTRTIEKVKREILYNNKKEGGLKMINLKSFQEGFYLKWAEQLLNDENKEWKSAARGFFIQLGGISVFKSNLKFKDFKGLNTIKSLFWKRVLESWTSLNLNDSHTGLGVHSGDPIFNNPKIRYKNKVLFMPQLIKRGAFLVKDITREGAILPAHEIERKYGSYPGIILDYNILFNAMNNQQIIYEETNTEASFFSTTLK